VPSQNVTFSGPPHDDEHPPGEPLARQLEAGLAARGWSTDDFDNWRDSGWAFTCARGASRLEVVLAPTDEGWFVQIAPRSAPGLLGRAFGAKPSASSAEIYELATHVHTVLAASGASKFAWRVDGPPDASCPAEPPPV
jgi:hypothetical protein